LHTTACWDGKGKHPSRLLSVNILQDKPFQPVLKMHIYHIMNLFCCYNHFICLCRHLWNGLFLLNIN